MTALHQPSLTAASHERAAFDAIAAVARSEAGLLLDPSKEVMVQSRLRNRIKALGQADFAAYSKFVCSPDGKPERRQMISALTTNVSHFFREQHHFDLFKEEILPGLIKKARAGGRVRLWSAGCSSGQEPYSIAMCMLSEAPDLVGKDVLILASDIDPAILQVARAGVYSASEVKGIPDPLKQQFLTPVADGSGQVALDPDLKKIVRFRELNLLHDWPMKGKFDAIFCRNVVIYFDAAIQAELWPRFHALLADDGYFFLGHSERISTSCQDLFQMIGLTSYSPLAPGAKPQGRRAPGAQKKQQPDKE